MEYWSIEIMQQWSNGVLEYCGRNTFDLDSSIPSFPLLHYSITPILHCFIILLFHYPITPTLQYSITPSLQYSSLLYIPSTWQTKVMIAVATMMATMLVTTAEVAAYPTAEALLPHCIPLRQPERATKTPKTAL